MVDLDAIRTRYRDAFHVVAYATSGNALGTITDALKDIPALLAEVERLQGMLDNLRSVAENNGIEALREEIKRLKARREMEF